MPLGKPKLTNEGIYRSYMIAEFLRSTGEREFPMQLASALFFVMAHDGCRQEDLIQATGMSASSVSRCVSWLGAHHRLDHRSGLRVVRRERDPDDPKRWRLYLTPKGHQWLNLFNNQLDMPLKEVRAIASRSANQTHDTDHDQDLG
jgi:DNA-binding MarR family transcriptional regulator